MTRWGQELDISPGSLGSKTVVAFWAAKSGSAVIIQALKVYPLWLGENFECCSVRSISHSGVLLANHCFAVLLKDNLQTATYCCFAD